MSDKRIENTRSIMQAFGIFCFVLFILFVICTLTVYYTFLAAQMEMPVQLKASYVVVIIMLCALWLWFGLITPIADWIKERKNRKERSEDEEIS